MSDTTRTFKSHLPDTDFTDKTTSSLEQDFKKFSLEPSNYSFTSTPSSVLSSERYCQHTKVISQENFDSCFNCGAYVSQNGVKTLKPKNMSFLTFFPPKTIYEAMTKRSFPLRKSMNQEYVEIRQAHVDWILELAEKLKISINSTHLAIHLLDFMMFHHPSLTPKIQLFAPVCLLVASKTVELDERIPFIPRLRRYTNSTYGVQDYTKAELQVLDAVDWNAQLSSPLEINEFLLCQGVVFSNDDFEEKENPNGKGQSGPEGLREISQYENTNYLGNKNLANRMGTNNAENYPNKPVNHALEDDFPAATQLARYHSTPGHVENHYQSPQTKVCMEKRIEEVLVNLENNYIRISTLLLKDADFVEWEPKVVSAATIAFLRSTNHINPVWNPELEAIASLKFSQIAGCYNLIKKRYNSLFTSNRNRYQRASSTLENNPNTPTTSHNNQTSDYKAPADEHDPNSRFSEQKSNSNYVKLPASSYEPPLRDDSHYKVRYGNGTITTEIPHKNGQTAAENYQSDPSHFQNYSAGYYNASVNGTVNGGANMENYHANGYRPSPQYDTYHQNGAYSYQNGYVPQASHRINGMHENGVSYQPRLDVLKK